jgi:citrate synthase
MILYDKISTKVDSWRERIRNLLRDHGSFKVADVTVDQILGGIRGVPIQISDISYVDAQEGIRLRGYTIPELLRLLPKPEGAQYPYTGGLFYLLMANELPTLEDALEVEEEWKKRSEVPEHVYSLLKQMPPEMHPMTMFSQAILMMQRRLLDRLPGRQYESDRQAAGCCCLYLQSEV